MSVPTGRMGVFAVCLLALGSCGAGLRPEGRSCGARLSQASVRFARLAATLAALLPAFDAVIPVVYRARHA